MSLTGPFVGVEWNHNADLLALEKNDNTGIRTMFAADALTRKSWSLMQVTKMFQFGEIDCQRTILLHLAPRFFRKASRNKGFLRLHHSQPSTFTIQH